MSNLELGGNYLKPSGNNKNDAKNLVILCQLWTQFSDML